MSAHSVAKTALSAVVSRASAVRYQWGDGVQGLSVPPGAAHRLSNPNPDEVVFLVISTPPTTQDRINVA